MWVDKLQEVWLLKRVQFSTQLQRPHEDERGVDQVNYNPRCQEACVEPVLVVVHSGSSVELPVLVWPVGRFHDC